MLVEPRPATTPMQGVLRHRPELAEKYRSFYAGLWGDALVPRRVLELCRRRIAHIHGCAAELAVADREVELSDSAEEGLRCGDVAAFSDAEQCALALAELMPHGVHRITDDMVAGADAAFGHAGCVSLLTALAFFDVNCRLKAVLEVPAPGGNVHVYEA